MGEKRFNVEIYSPSTGDAETDNYITLRQVQAHLVALEEDGGEMTIQRVRDRKPGEL